MKVCSFGWSWSVLLVVSVSVPLWGGCGCGWCGTSGVVWVGGCGTLLGPDSSGVGFLSGVGCRVGGSGVVGWFLLLCLLAVGVVGGGWWGCCLRSA